MRSTEETETKPGATSSTHALDAVLANRRKKERTMPKNTKAPKAPEASKQPEAPEAPPVVLLFGSTLPAGVTTDLRKVVAVRDDKVRLYREPSRFAFARIASEAIAKGAPKTIDEIVLEALNDPAENARMRSLRSNRANGSISAAQQFRFLREYNVDSKSKDCYDLQ